MVRAWKNRATRPAVVLAALTAVLAGSNGTASAQVTSQTVCSTLTYQCTTYHADGTTTVSVYVPEPGAAQGPSSGYAPYGAYQTSNPGYSSTYAPYNGPYAAYQTSALPYAYGATGYGPYYMYQTRYDPFARMYVNFGAAFFHFCHFSVSARRVICR